MTVFNGTEFAGILTVPRTATPPVNHRFFEATYLVPTPAPIADDFVRLFLLPAGYEIIHLMVSWDATLQGAGGVIDIGTVTDLVDPPTAGDIDCYILGASGNVAQDSLQYPNSTATSGIGRRAQSVDEYVTLQVRVAALTAGRNIFVGAIGIKTP